MRFDVSPDEIRKANVPHEIFLTNLIGNHILMTVGAGGVAGSFPWVMAVIPVMSFSLLGYTLWRARALPDPGPLVRDVPLAGLRPAQPHLPRDAAPAARGR